MPRHPPNALKNLTTKIKDARVHCAVLKLRAVPHPATPSPRQGTGSSARPRSTSPRRPPAAGTEVRAHARSLRTQQCANSRPSTDHVVPCPRRSCTRRDRAERPTIDVPPMSNHLGTLARDWPWTPRNTWRLALLRKEVIQPHLPVRLPCYDFVPIANPTFDGSLPRVGPPASGVTDFRDVTGGVYKARERIHRSVADLRLLATPTSWGRVADPNPN